MSTDVALVLEIQNDHRGLRQLHQNAPEIVRDDPGQETLALAARFRLAFTPSAIPEAHLRAPVQPLRVPQAI